MSVSPGVYSGGRVVRVAAGGEAINTREGKGKYIYANTFFTYQGSYVNGRKHGHGRLSLNSGPGDFYDGDFVNDAIEGHGVKQFHSMDKQWIYKGQFKDGEFDGQGELTDLTNNIHYIGHFSRNRFSGPGRLSGHASAAEGTFKDNKLNDENAVIVYGVNYYGSDAEGGEFARYTGSVIGGVRCGLGEERFYHGDGTASQYRGIFNNDQRSGQGIFTHAPSGIRVSGLWSFGLPSIASDRLRLRAVEPANASEATQPPRSAAGARSQAATLTSPSSGRLAGRKRNDEAAKQAAELEARLAAATRGVVLIESAIDNKQGATTETGMAELPVRDLIAPISVAAGSSLSGYYICVSAPDGATAVGESNRNMKIQIRARAANTQTANMGSPTAASTTPKSPAGKKKPAAAVPSEPADAPPSVAFCCCAADEAPEANSEAPAFQCSGLCSPGVCELFLPVINGSVNLSSVRLARWCAVGAGSCELAVSDHTNNLISAQECQPELNTHSNPFPVFSPSPSSFLPGLSIPSLPLLYRLSPVASPVDVSPPVANRETASRGGPKSVRFKK